MANEQNLTQEQRELVEQKKDLEALVKKLPSQRDKQGINNQIHELFVNRVQGQANGLLLLWSHDQNEDAKLTLPEFLASAAEALGKDKEDKAFIQKAVRDFNILQKLLPDDKPTDNSIALTEVADRELKFLEKIFPEEIKRLNQPGSENNPSQAPYEFLRKISECSCAQKPETERL